MCIRDRLGHAATGADPKAAEDARQAERLLQEGMDNIMGYQGPPRREGE